MSGTRALASLTIPLTGVLLLAALTGCDESSGPSTAMIYGIVRSGGQAASGATVYLAASLQPAGPALDWRDSTVTCWRGTYRFTDLEPGVYHVYAARRAQAGAADVFEMVSPLSDSLTITTRNRVRTADLSLRPVHCEGSLGGRIVLNDGTPAARAFVTIWRLEGFGWTRIADVTADELGQYVFFTICTGTYRLVASSYVGGGDFPFVGEITDAWHDGSQALVLPDLRLGSVIVRKPAIYLYPDRTTRFSVRLLLPAGAQLLRSEPPYGDGWRVTVAPGGLIEGKSTYLFYELRSGRTPPLDAGWCVSRQDLPSRLPRILAALGLNENETADFLDYWLPPLQGHAWWRVQPAIDGAIEPLAGLEVAPAPDSARRVWVYFQGGPAPVELAPPNLPPFRRAGTALVEWGGAILGD